MMSLRRHARHGFRSTLSDPSSLRVEVCPPSLRHAPVPVWNRLVFWLTAPAPMDAAPPLNRLPGVRTEFLRCLEDVLVEGSVEAAARIGRALSLRELWHLRAEVYRLVGLQHSQAEAEARLTRLNRHFPTRAPRSAFNPL